MNRIRDLTETEFAKDVLVLFSRNSLGHILPSQRGITVGWDSNHENVKLIAYLDRKPISDSVLSILPFTEAQVECIFSKASYADLDSLDICLYLRYEPEMGYFEAE